MKAKLYFVAVVTICIITALVFFFEQHDTRTADAMDGVLVWKENVEKMLV